MPSPRKRSTSAAAPQPPQLPQHLPAIESPDALQDGAGFAQGALDRTDRLGRTQTDGLIEDDPAVKRHGAAR